MSFPRTFWMIPLAAGLAFGAGAPQSNKAGGPPQAERAAPNEEAKLPPVLQDSDPADSGVVVLPGEMEPSTPPAPPLSPLARPAAPHAALKAMQTRPVPETRRPAPVSIVRRTPGAADRAAARPIFKAVRYPAGFEQDPAAFLHTEIGRWSLNDARTLLGEPFRERPSLDDRQKPDGRILAFADPTGRYKELELDFGRARGRLRTVFAYPKKLRWESCRHLWGGDVTFAKANKGRIFYSYKNRRLDVLVAPDGSVISLGLY